jgi:uncharacterized protein with PhoU and TrkA domain
MDLLERAARDGRRVVVVRRGNEYVIVARRIDALSSREALIGVHPMTGDEIRFDLAEIEAFQVVG